MTRSTPSTSQEIHDSLNSSYSSLNKKSATTLFISDTLSALIAASLVAPIVATIDKSIIAHASGLTPLSEGLSKGFRSLLSNPFRYATQPFVRYVWVVYLGTYLTANYVHSWCDFVGREWQGPKFVGTSVANIGLTIWKDRNLTRMYGKNTMMPTHSPSIPVTPFTSSQSKIPLNTIPVSPSISSPRRLPKMTYALFTLRDSLTVASSFNFPPLLAPLITANTPLNQSQSDTVAQLLTPCAVQFVSTPLHLWALDTYNHPKDAFRDRVAFVRREYWKSVCARVGRIFPAFGIGGVTNQRLKSFLVAVLE